MFNEQLMIARIKNFIKEEQIESITKKKHAYSNHVYEIKTKGCHLIYKEYNKIKNEIRKTNEMKICKLLGFPKILYEHEDYRIEEYVEHMEVCWNDDLAKIAQSLRMLHDTLVDTKILSLENLFDILLEEEIVRMKIRNENDSCLHKVKINDYKTEEEQFINVNKEKIYTFEEKVNNVDENKVLNNLSHEQTLNLCERRIAVLLEIKDRLFKIPENPYFKKSLLCHNDLQIGNMMKIGEDVKFIDYEYSCVGNPLVDISNLFCERMSDYTTDVFLKDERGYSYEQKKEFIKVYNNNKDVERILKEIEDVQVYSHFYWYLWGKNLYLDRSGPSKSFDYLNFSLFRLNMCLKKKLITTDEYLLLTGEFENQY